MWKWKITGVLTTVFFSWLSVTGSAAAICGNGPPLPPEGLKWPVEGRIATPWTLDCNSNHGHRGVDLNAAAGSTVQPAAAGRVIFAGYTPAEGGGNTISIEHPGGLRSTYLHLGQIFVSNGDQVASGQAIGTAGNIPLHFGLKLAGEHDAYFDPLEVIGAPPASAPVTLQPDTAPAVSSDEAAPVPEPVVENLTLPNPGLSESNLQIPATADSPGTGETAAATPTSPLAIAPLPPEAAPYPGTAPRRSMITFAPGPFSLRQAPEFLAGFARSTPILPSGDDLAAEAPATNAIRVAGRRDEALANAAPSADSRFADAFPAAAFIATLLAALITARCTRVPATAAVARAASAQPTAPG